jgi:uncharacterized cupredoxin-like copper-binding protein
MRKLVLLLSVLSLATVGLAACGGDDGEESAATQPATTGGGGGGGDGGTVDVSADPGGELAFQESSLEAPAGSVTFNFDNPADITHDFCIEDSGGSEVGCTDQIASSSSELTANLKPGKYTFFCSVDAHRESGMEGPLTVK